jgi:hypothetical protein
MGFLDRLLKSKSSQSVGKAPQVAAPSSPDGQLTHPKGLGDDGDSEDSDEGDL